MDETQDEYIFDPIMQKHVKLPKGIEIRLGKEFDHRMILEFSQETNSMEGWDYLPGMWKQWVKDPNMVLAVAIKEEKMRRYVFENFGNPEVLMRTSHHRQLMLDLQSQGKEHFTVVFEAKYTFLGLQITEDQFKDISLKLKCITPDNDNHYKLEEIKEKHQFAEIISDQATAFDLFPSRHLVLVQFAFEVGPNTANDIWQENRQIFVSKEDKRCNTLSIGTAFPCTSGTGYNIDCFGYMDPDIQLQHIRRHFLQIPKYHKRFGGTICIYFSVPAYCDLETTYNLFREFNAPDNDVGIRHYIGNRTNMIPSKI